MWVMEAAAPAPPPRKTSPRVSALLSAATPRYDPAAAAREAEEARRRLELQRVTPANEIVRLAPYIVREPKLPKPEEVMSPRALETLAMQRYLGNEDGLDRGVLNLFTVKSLWKKLPVLGRYPLLGFATNEERAIAIYRAEKQAEEMETMRSLLSPALQPNAAPGKKP